MAKKYIIQTLADTEKLAHTVASRLHGGQTIGLIGDLGAGKTTFVQFLARALGVHATVNSPTFNIIKVYKIKNSKIQKFIHIDAYRLNAGQELTALGVEEYFNDPHTVTVIEWADKVREILPAQIMLLRFSHTSKKHRVTLSIDK